MAALLKGGETHRFVEERYIYSIDKHLTLKGSIRFDAEGMQIDYSEPERKRIVYSDSSMDVYDASGALLQHVDLEAQPVMKLYMHSLFALYRGDFETLKNYFTVKEEGRNVYLTPIPPADKAVHDIHVTRLGDAVETIETVMSSHDTITIYITE